MVYFQIFEKKMKTKVMARSRVEADEIVRNQLIVHKIDEIKNDGLNVIDYYFKNIFN